MRDPMNAQFCETLHIGGYVMAMCSEPLNVYLELHGLDENLQGRRGCARGYEGTWEIRDGRLYLVGLLGTLKNDNDAKLETFFPGHPAGVLADWYTGPIIEPDAQQLRYVPTRDCIYDCDLFINVERGTVSEAYLSRAGGPKDCQAVVERYGRLFDQGCA